MASEQQDQVLRANEFSHAAGGPHTDANIITVQAPITPTKLKVEQADMTHLMASAETEFGVSPLAGMGSPVLGAAYMPAYGVVHHLAGAATGQPIPALLAASSPMMGAATIGTLGPTHLGYASPSAATIVSSNGLSRGVKISVESKNETQEEAAAISIEMDNNEEMIEKVLDILSARFPLDAFYKAVGRREEVIRSVCTAQRDSNVPIPYSENVTQSSEDDQILMEALRQKWSQFVSQVEPELLPYVSRIVPAGISASKSTMTTKPTTEEAKSDQIPKPVDVQHHEDKEQQTYHEANKLQPILGDTQPAEDETSRRRNDIPEVIQNFPPQTIEQASSNNNDSSPKDAVLKDMSPKGGDDNSSAFADEGKWEEINEDELRAEMETQHSKSMTSDDESSISADLHTNRTQLTTSAQMISVQMTTTTTMPPKGAEHSASHRGSSSRASSRHSSSHHRRHPTSGSIHQSASHKMSSHYSSPRDQELHSPHKSESRSHRTSHGSSRHHGEKHYRQQQEGSQHTLSKTALIQHDKEYGQGSRHSRKSGSICSSSISRISAVYRTRLSAVHPLIASGFANFPAVFAQFALSVAPETLREILTDNQGSEKIMGIAKMLNCNAVLIIGLIEFAEKYADFRQWCTSLLSIGETNEENFLSGEKAEQTYADDLNISVSKASVSSKTTPREESTFVNVSKATEKDDARAALFREPSIQIRSFQSRDSKYEGESIQEQSVGSIAKNKFDQKNEIGVIMNRDGSVSGSMVSSAAATDGKWVEMMSSNNLARGLVTSSSIINQQDSMGIEMQKIDTNRSSTDSLNMIKTLDSEDAFIKRKVLHWIGALFTRMGVPAPESASDNLPTENEVKKYLSSQKDYLNKLILRTRGEVYETIRTMLESLGFISNLEKVLDAQVNVDTIDESNAETVAIDCFVKEAAVRLAIVTLAETLQVSSGNQIDKFSNELQALFNSPHHDNSTDEAFNEFLSSVDTHRSQSLKEALNNAIDSVEFAMFQSDYIMTFVDEICSKANSFTIPMPAKQPISRNTQSSTSSHPQSSVTPFDNRASTQQQPQPQQTQPAQPDAQIASTKPFTSEVPAIAPTVQQPTVQPPTVQQPTVQQPIVQQPTVQQPTMQQPTVQHTIQPPLASVKPTTAPSTMTPAIQIAPSKPLNMHSSLTRQGISSSTTYTTTNALPMMPVTVPILTPTTTSMIPPPSTGASTLPPPTTKTVLPPITTSMRSTTSSVLPSMASSILPPTSTILPPTTTTGYPVQQSGGVSSGGFTKDVSHSVSTIVPGATSYYGGVSQQSLMDQAVSETTTLPIDLSGTPMPPSMMNVGVVLADMGAKLTSMGQSVHLLEASMTPAHARSPSHYVVARTDLVAPNSVGLMGSQRNSSLDMNASSIIAAPDTSLLRSNYLRAHTVAGPQVTQTSQISGSRPPSSTSYAVPSPLMVPQQMSNQSSIRPIEHRNTTGVIRATGTFHSTQPSQGDDSKANEGRTSSSIQASVSVTAIANRKDRPLADGSSTTPAAQTWTIQKNEPAAAFRTANSMQVIPETTNSTNSNNNNTATIKASPLVKLQTENKNVILGQLAKLYAQDGSQ